MKRLLKKYEDVIVNIILLSIVFVVPVILGFILAKL